MRATVVTLVLLSGCSQASTALDAAVDGAHFDSRPDRGTDGALDALDAGEHHLDAASDEAEVPPSDASGDVARDTASDTVPDAVREPVVTLVSDAPGDDWTRPDWVRPTTNSGFFSERVSAMHHVDTRVVDLTWRQLQPTRGTFSTTTAGRAQDMNLASYDTQLGRSEPFWMRLWASAVDWTPDWVVAECGLSPIGTDYDGQQHLPIWNDCYWSRLVEVWREVFIRRGLRSDPRLRFVYVPGAFTWSEFDYSMINSAVRNHGLTYETFAAWYARMLRELVNVMNGENSDPSDDYAYKLVFTGEDYPYGPWGTRDDFFARDAVAAGMGIRTGITEVFNNHLSEVPAYGTTIADDGHMVTNDSWMLFDGRRIAATENECFNDCGFRTDDPYYAVTMANLKALQLRMNWIYVVPRPSYLAEYAEHWEWVRHELGKTASTAPDAWAMLREAEDRYWTGDRSRTWSTRPWVRNFERWLVQRDVAPDGLSRRGSEVRTGVLDPDNGTSYEGRITDHARGSDYLYFDLDDRFVAAQNGDVLVKVTYRDRGGASWRLEYPRGSGAVGQSPPVRNGNTGSLRTATFRLEGVVFDNSLRGGSDFRLYNGGGEDLEVRFVRVVRVLPPR
jgi:hypothetical protein